MQTMSLIAINVSAFLFLFSILLGRVMHAKSLNSRKNFTMRRSYLLTPFQVFLIGFFIATATLFFPIYYFDYFATEIGIVKILKSILLSIHNTMRLFVIDGDFDIIKNTITSTNVGSELAAIYSIYGGFLFVIAPVLTAGFVLSFFKNATASVKYFFYPKSDIYIMSELNERSIALAEDILTNPDIKGKKLVLFADVFEKEEEENFELVEQAKRLGAICFKKDITEIGLRPLIFNIDRKFFFVGDDEDENVKQSLILIARCRNKKCYNSKRTHFYVLSNSVESEVLLNSTDNGKMKVRRVRQARNLALDTVRKYSIFNTNIIKDDKKFINIVIVGLGGYGLELLKTVCWCGQMDGYTLNIHVFDEGEGLERRIKSVVPELVEYNHNDIEGEPYYDIYFHDNINVRDQAFLEKLSEIHDISLAYVTLGDDELNIETAMRMRMQFGRDLIEFDRNIPPILAVVYSSIKNATIKSNDGLYSVQGENYDITFIGSMKDRYSLNSIEQSDLEVDGLMVHLYWSLNEPEDKVQVAKDSYEKYEYNRRSSIAQALHIHFREKLGCLYLDDIDRGSLLEHKRWNAYMRAEGYIRDPLPLIDKADKAHNDISKTHKNLVPYNELSESEKRKDIVFKLEEVKRRFKHEQI